MRDSQMDDPTLTIMGDYQHLIPEYGLDGKRLKTVGYMRILNAVDDQGGATAALRRLIFRELLAIHTRDYPEG